MNPTEIKIRVGGLSVSTQVAGSVSLQRPVVFGANPPAPKIRDRIRSRFLRLRGAEVEREIRYRLPGKVIWAGMAIPGEAPVFINTRTSREPAVPGGDLAISCGMRVITSSMLLDHVASGACSLQASVAEMLEIQSLQGTPAAQLLMEDLLNHRHGLEDAGVNAGEFLKNGWIDERALVNALNRNPPRFKPGRCYSYSQVGFWLAGAVLQRLERRTFGEIVASAGVRVAGDVCPAMGGDCTISGKALLKFLLDRIQRGRDGCRAPVVPSESNVKALPGWSPFERGVQLGWKVFPDGWLGHNSQLPNQTGLIRVHPETGTALFLWVDRAAVASVATWLFRGILPEPSVSDLPKRLPAEDWVKMNRSRYFGEFRAEGRTLRIHEADAEGISALIHGGSSTGRRKHARIKFVPAENDIFFAVPRRGEDFPFIQLLASADGAVDAVWTGRKVWPRVGSA